MNTNAYPEELHSQVWPKENIIVCENCGHRVPLLSTPSGVNIASKDVHQAGFWYVVRDESNQDRGQYSLNLCPPCGPKFVGKGWYRFIPKEKPEDMCGLCPICGAEPDCLNVRSTHWMVCHDHKVCWCFGGNVFGAWKYENEEIWAKNVETLNTYDEVEPGCNPFVCVQCHFTVPASTEVWKAGWLEIPSPIPNWRYADPLFICPRCAADWIPLHESRTGPESEEPPF
jgi:hypothetical protein